VTESTGATCPTCANALPVAGAPCPRCAAAWSSGRQDAQYAAPQYAPYPQYQPAPFAAAPYPGTAYPPAPYQPNPAAMRAPKSAGVAVLLTILWIGAGHLYLDRLGTGLVLMGAHLVVGFFLLFLFPFSFVIWLAAAIGCSIWCSNLAGQINAGTVPPRETW
jgi:TM2 domain-containing membrane protein YozV